MKIMGTKFWEWQMTEKHFTITSFISKTVLSLILMLAIAVFLPMHIHAKDLDEILSYTLASDPLTLDPQIADDESSQMLITNLFEGLVRISSDGNIKSGMAESWDISQDGKTYIGNPAKLFKY